MPGSSYLLLQPTGEQAGRGNAYVDSDGTDQAVKRCSSEIAQRFAGKQVEAEGA